MLTTIEVERLTVCETERSVRELDNAALYQIQFLSATKFEPPEFPQSIRDDSTVLWRVSIEMSGGGAVDFEGIPHGVTWGRRLPQEVSLMMAKGELIAAMTKAEQLKDQEFFGDHDES